MPEVTQLSNPHPVGKLLVLSDAASGSKAVLAPERGALITSFRVRERELLYLDRATLEDPTKNVRGGIPVLFPSPGKLAADSYRFAGKSGHLKQHGFARTLPWKVTRTSTKGGASASLLLEASALTLGEFPWQFRAELGFTLDGTCLRIVARVHNCDSSPMPFALGYHPYFKVDDKAGARIDTHAKHAFDNVTKREVPFDGFDLTRSEVDLHLLDHGSSESALRFSDGSRLALRGSAEFSRWVVWTLAGNDFVCLEPWTAPGNALNSGEGLLLLAPGEQRECSLSIEFSAGALAQNS